MLDLNREQPLSLPEAARRCPRVDGRPVHASAVWRWCTKGLGPERTKLEHMRVGRRCVTTEEALQRFFHRTALATAARLEPPPMDTGRPTARQERQGKRWAWDAHCKAVDRLEQRGMINAETAARQREQQP